MTEVYLGNADHQTPFSEGRLDLAVDLLIAGAAKFPLSFGDFSRMNAVKEGKSTNQISCREPSPINHGSTTIIHQTTSGVKRESRPPSPSEGAVVTIVAVPRYLLNF